MITSIILSLLILGELSKYLGGVILYEETLGQSTSDGIPFSKLLSDMGIIVGIKVDKVKKKRKKAHLNIHYMFF